MQTDFTQKNYDYVAPCIESGYLDLKDRSAFMDAGDILFGGMLHPYLLKGEDIFEQIMESLN